MSSILIVDDDNYLRTLYVEVFQEAGFTVFAAPDGATGLDLARQQKPNIIFTGIIMPNLTGFELIHKLKENPDTAAIPVIISSHLGREADRQEAEKLGAKAFVVKGLVSPRQVVNLVLTLLGEKAGTKIWRVRVVPDDLDAKRLAKDLSLPGKLILELSPSLTGLSQEFQAKVISDDGRPMAPIPPSSSPGEDLSAILGDIEKKLK
jgi:twitching motility two-component system response regulator PilH